MVSETEKAKVCPLVMLCPDIPDASCWSGCALRIGDECAFAVMAKGLRGLAALTLNETHRRFLADLQETRLTDSVAEATRKELVDRLRELEK